MSDALNLEGSLFWWLLAVLLQTSFLLVVGTVVAVAPHSTFRRGRRQI